MTFSSTRFDMGSVMNKLRAIVETNGTEDQAIQAQAKSAYHDPGMETGGQEIDHASFSRTMQRLAAIKDAVSEEHYDALKSGVRAMYMNRRPNLQQMSALMDLLETMLSYIAQDTTLFQRLKTDLSKDKQQAQQQATAQANQEIGAPSTVTEPPAQQPPSTMRDLK